MGTEGNLWLPSLLIGTSLALILPGFKSQGSQKAAGNKTAWRKNVKIDTQTMEQSREPRTSPYTNSKLLFPTKSQEHTSESALSSTA